MDSAGAVRQSQFEVTGFDYSSRLGSVEEMPLYLYLTRVACTQLTPGANCSLDFLSTCAEQVPKELESGIL